MNLTKLFVALVMCFAFLLIDVPQSQAAGGRLVTLPFRAVAWGVSVPRRIQLNSLERRSCRGNCLATARLQGVAARRR